MALFDTPKIFRTPAEVLDASAQRTAALGLGQLFQRGFQHAREMRQRDAEFQANMAQRQQEFTQTKEQQDQQFRQNLAERQWEFTKSYDQNESQFTRKLTAEEQRWGQQFSQGQLEFAMSYAQREQFYNQDLAQRNLEWRTNSNLQYMRYDIEKTTAGLANQLQEETLKAQKMNLEERKNVVADMAMLRDIYPLMRTNPLTKPPKPFTTLVGEQKYLDAQQMFIEQKLNLYRQERDTDFEAKLSPAGKSMYDTLRAKIVHDVQAGLPEDRRPLEQFMRDAVLNPEMMNPMANFMSFGKGGPGSMERRGYFSWAMEAQAMQAESQGRFADAEALRKQARHIVDPRGATAQELTPERAFRLRTGEAAIKDRFDLAVKTTVYGSEKFKKAEKERDEALAKLHQTIFVDPAITPTVLDEQTVKAVIDSFGGAEAVTNIQRALQSRNPTKPLPPAINQPGWVSPNLPPPPRVRYKTNE